MTEQPPRLDTVPCGDDPDVRRLMMDAAPCRCGSRQLLPVSDAEDPPTLAIACDGCGVIEGDAPNLAGAVSNWNAWARGDCPPEIPAAADQAEPADGSDDEQRQGAIKP